MNRFILLRIHTESSQTPFVKDEITVKFFPVLDAGKKPIILLAPSAEAAFADLRKRLPRLAHLLALESEATYNATVARLTALRLARRNAASTIRSPTHENA